MHATCLTRLLTTGNGKPVSTDLRDATKPLLAATARVLGGVLPRHVAPSAAGGGTSDWLWASGDSPLVATSPCRASFGQVDADVIHRNYLAQALHVGHCSKWFFDMTPGLSSDLLAEAVLSCPVLSSPVLQGSAKIVNKAILRLNGGVDGSTHTREENAAAAFKVDWKELVESYEQVEKVWKRALGRAGRMDLDSACSFILPMMEAANAFDAKVGVVVRHMTDLRCSNEVGVVDQDAVEEALTDGPSRESTTPTS